MIEEWKLWAKEEGLSELPIEGDEHIFLRCPMCESAEKITKKYPDNEPHKFLICADGHHAICCSCTYRVQIPQSKSTREVK